MRAIAIALATMLVGGAGVAASQPELAKRLHATKLRDDVYVLPPPAQLRIATLGHHEAAVDMLWAKLLVEFGVHLSEKRPFADILLYIDAILELDPSYGPVYRYATTLICFRPDGGDLPCARASRRYLEKGLAALPHDRDVWLEYGQFMAYMSPSYLPPGPELDDWKRIGAEALARAVDLGSDANRSLSAATLMTRYGAKDSAIRTLRRAYALTDSPDARNEIAARLGALTSSVEADRLQEDGRYLDGRWRRTLPFASRATFVLIGPLRDTASCAGPARALAPECSDDWTALLPSSRDD